MNHNQSVLAHEIYLRADDGKALYFARKFAPDIEALMMLAYKQGTARIPFDVDSIVRTYSSIG